MLLTSTRTATVVVLHPSLLQDSGQGVAVTESVGLPIELAILGRQAELLLEVLPSVEEMVSEGLAAREVLVSFDPVNGGNLPATLFHPLLNPLEHLGVV